MLKRNLVLAKDKKGKSFWRPRVTWWKVNRVSGRRDALDEVEANMSDTYRSEDSDGDDDDISEGDAAEVLLAGAGQALLSVDDILGTEQARQAPPVRDEDDTPSEADLRAALDDLMSPAAESGPLRKPAADCGRRLQSDSTGGTSNTGETGASSA